MRSSYSRTSIIERTFTSIGASSKHVKTEFRLRVSLVDGVRLTGNILGLVGRLVFNIDHGVLMGNGKFECKVSDCCFWKAFIMEGEIGLLKFECLVKCLIFL